MRLPSHIHYRGPARVVRRLSAAGFLLALLAGCIAPQTAQSELAGSDAAVRNSPQQRPGRQQPPVAEEKEWQPGPSVVRAAMGVAFLQQEALEASVRHLSSPGFEGRLTGTPGYARAARFAAEQFRASGLQPGGSDGSYFQPFTVEANEVTGPMDLRVIYPDWKGAPYRFGTDYVARGFTGSGRVEDAPVVFVGYGLEDPESGWNDYQDVEAAGKVALMFMGTPPGTVDWGERSRPRFKTTLARRHGARAVLLIDDPGAQAVSPIGSVYHGQEGTHQADMPVLSIRNSIADDLLHGTPHTAVSLRRQIADSGRPFPLELRTRATLEAHAEYRADAQTWNVVGWIEGSDPTVSDEWVVVGGHLDHVGQQSGVVFPGAKDNAAGSVMVLALAKAMSRAPVKPRRSVYFVLFAGEELFLLGSEYFAANPPRPIGKAVGMINLDVVGVGPTLALDGGATTPRFQQMAVDADRLYGGFGIAERDPTPARPGASDHSAFINAGVPTIYFHSGGASGRAHTPADVADTIDYDAFTRTARVVYLTLFQMADRDR